MALAITAKMKAKVKTLFQLKLVWLKYQQVQNVVIYKAGFVSRPLNDVIEISTFTYSYRLSPKVYHEDLRIRKVFTCIKKDSVQDFIYYAVACFSLWLH